MKELVALCVDVTFAKSGKPAIRHCLGLGKGARDPALVGDHALQAHGAVFAEVKVDPALDPLENWLIGPKSRG